MSLNYIIYATFAAAVLSFFVGIVRNTIVLEVRLSFKGEDYDFLPTYNQMVFHPRHQLRFTKKQWQKWVDRQKNL